MRVLRVALDVPLATLFDYLGTPEVDARAGDRVVVPFGTRSRVGVVVEEAGESAVEAAKLRPVARVLGDAPRLTAPWLEFMRFLAGYYQRPLGETVMGALPPRLRSRLGTLYSRESRRVSIAQSVDCTSHSPPGVESAFATGATRTARMSVSRTHPSRPPPSPTRR